MERPKYRDDDRLYGRERRSRSVDSSAGEEERRRRRRQRDSRDGDARDTRKDERRRDDKYRNSSYRRSRSRSPRNSHRSSRDDREKRDSRHRDRHRDRDRDRKYRDEEREPIKQALQRSGPLPSQGESYAMTANNKGTDGRAAPSDEVEKQRPNLQSTGLLAAASNSVAQLDGTTIALKYHEPPEARKPPSKEAWKLFVFKGSDILDTIDLSIRSCWLAGREAAVVDLIAEHPSISKQHAVIQFRYIEKRNEFGDRVGRVKPYLIDLESANGTVLNGERLPEGRYLELRDKDMIKFGQSTREYVLMLPPK